MDNLHIPTFLKPNWFFFPDQLSDHDITQDGGPRTLFYMDMGWVLKVWIMEQALRERDISQATFKQDGNDKWKNRGEEMDVRESFMWQAELTQTV